jgi:hypothetical protein
MWHSDVRRPPKRKSERKATSMPSQTNTTCLTIRKFGGVEIPWPAVKHLTQVIMVHGKASNTDFSKLRMYVSFSALIKPVPAYVEGLDIFFAPGKFQPNTVSGRKLIEDLLIEFVCSKRALQAPGRVWFSAASNGDNPPAHVPDPALVAATTSSTATAVGSAAPSF